MPYFTLQMDPSGRPMVNAVIGASQARAAALKAAGQATPQAQTVRALIDTGASGTCVDPMILRALGLTATGVVAVNTPSTGASPVMQDQYDITLLVPGPSQTHPPLFIGNLPVLEAEFFQAQGFHALIGRDVLAMCLMNYDGANGFFSIAY